MGGGRLTAEQERKKGKGEGHGLFRRNAFLLIGSNVSMAALGFLFWKVVHWRYLPLYGTIETERMMGIAAVLISTSTLAGTFSIFGMDMALIRFLPKRSTGEKKRMLLSSLAFAGACGLLFSLIFASLIHIFYPQLLMIEGQSVYPLFVLFSIVWGLFVIINGALLEGQRADLIFLKNVLFFSGGKLFFPLLLFSLGALGIFLSWGIAVIIAFSISLVLIAFLYREKAPRPVISLGILRPIASYSFLNYLTNLFNLLPSLVLPMVVLVRADANMAAYAYVAWMIATITFMVPNSVALSLFASCSNNPGSIKEKAKHSLYLSSALVVPMVIGIYLFGDLVLQFMGANFSIAAVTLSWLSLSALPIMGIATMVAVKRVKKHMVEVMVAYAITFSISLSFWYVLLPKWGMISIGVVWFLANSLAFLFLLFSLKYRGDLR